MWNIDTQISNFLFSIFGTFTSTIALILIVLWVFWALKMFFFGPASLRRCLRTSPDITWYWFGINMWRIVGRLCVGILIVGMFVSVNTNAPKIKLITNEKAQQIKRETAITKPLPPLKTPTYSQITDEERAKRQLKYDQEIKERVDLK